MIAGVDEAGRGPLVGSVFAAAVILPPDFDLPHLNDSKKLTPAKRERLYEAMCADDNVMTGVGIADNGMIWRLPELFIKHITKLRFLQPHGKA